MAEQRTIQDRASLLADVAEMYYLEQKNQAEIARLIGVTRSMVSRLLTEARESGIVEIRVRRQVQSDHELSLALMECFGLKDASVVPFPHTGGEHLLSALGSAAAQMLKRYLAPHIILGLAWGTSISATVDAFEASNRMPVKVVQLVGAMGARNMEYDGHDLVARMSEKIGGEAYYLNAPYLCQSAEMAKSLLETKSVRETINLGRKADVALLGVGTTTAEYSSFYLAGYISQQELQRLRREGAVGDVGGLHFDIQGGPASEDFSDRLVSIRRKEMLVIPVRLGVAGGEGKVDAILGALRGHYLNVLVTDSMTARKILDRAKTT
jgi:DNA-binding transcriptional regulator LsrR (DeoR family)